MPTIDGQLTVWDVADEWSVLTGIKVVGCQEMPEVPEFEANLLRETAEQLDIEDFLSGRIRPSGVVVLFVGKTRGSATIWELSPRFSAIWLSCGEEPGALASLRLQ
jgi:hypothetical protein